MLRDPTSRKSGTGRFPKPQTRTLTYPNLHGLLLEFDQELLQESLPVSRGSGFRVFRGLGFRGSGV